MLFFLVCCLLYCNIFNLTGKLITLIIITSSGSVILIITVDEIPLGQNISGINQYQLCSAYTTLLNQNLFIWFLFFLQM